MEIPEWTPAKKDSRSLSDLVALWHQHHGAGLKDGTGRKSILIAMCEALGNPRADRFTPDQFAEYRMRRMKAGISANTMNREQAYLRAVFNENIRLGHWKKENPLKMLRAFKIDEREMSYLEQDQIVVLLSNLNRSKNPHVTMVAKICLATGARWGEAETLRATQIRNGLIQFVQTKSSKARAVPITDELEKSLREHHREIGEGECLFSTSYSAFRKVLIDTKLKTIEWSANSYLETYLRKPFHDEWREYTGIAESSWAS